jgi:hypothetical protein
MTQHVDISDAVAWLSGIPWEEWPQGKIGVQMVHDPDWRGFGAATQSLVDEVMRGPLGFGLCRVHQLGLAAYNRMLSVVMPGRSILAHRDEQPYELWRGRIHVPLLTNDEAVFMIAGERLQMYPGRAYWIDTRHEHSVFNGGATPRVHMMFDLRVS